MPGKVHVAGPAGGSAVARVTIEGTIIRKDGTIENLGVIADSGLLNERPPSIFQRIRSALWPKH